jgi:hypothetical protein
MEHGVRADLGFFSTKSTLDTKRKEISHQVKESKNVSSAHLSALALNSVYRSLPFLKGGQEGFFLQVTATTAGVDENGTVATVPYTYWTNFPYPLLKKKGDPRND